MAIEVGSKLPEATFKVVTADGLGDVSVADLTAGKKVALFAIPGAFTPTCAAKHVPSIASNMDALKAKGVDTVALTSVNDAFVMDAFAKDQGVEGKVSMLADGNGDFATAIGLDLDGSGFGLGKRSHRYAMVVENGVVTYLQVEEAPSIMDVSSAEKMVDAL